MKIVINKCYGGFDLSPMALDRLADLESEGSLNKYYYEGIIENSNYVLIKKVTDDMDIFKDGVIEVGDVGFILTNEIFDEEVTILRVDDFEKLDKLKVTSAKYSEEYKRTDKNLITVVEELGDEASTFISNLIVVEIPDGSFWSIERYDGWETVRYSASEIKVV